MMKNSFRTLSTLALIAVFALQAACGPLSAPNDPKQVDQLFAELVGRLKGANVPIVDAKVTSYTPIAVDVLLQSISSEKDAPSADLWNQALVVRESTLAYQYGLKIGEFSMGFVDLKGKVFGRATTFLYDSDASQQLMLAKTPNLDDKLAQDSLALALDVHGLASEIRVASTDTGISLGQLAELKLILDDAKQASEWAPTIVLDARAAVDKLNQSSSVHIGVMRLTMSEKGGRQLLDYIYDADVRSEFIYKVPEIPSWFPEPEATQTALPSLMLTQLAKPTIPEPVKTLAPYPGSDDSVVPLSPNKSYP